MFGENKLDMNKVERCADGELHEWTGFHRSNDGYVASCKKCNRVKHILVVG